MHKITITVANGSDKKAILDALAEMEEECVFEEAFNVHTEEVERNPLSGLGRMQKNMLKEARKFKGWARISNSKQSIGVAKSLEKRGLIKFAELDNLIGIVD